MINNIYWYGKGHLEPEKEISGRFPWNKPDKKSSEKNSSKKK